jgi:hypothetical protein
LGHLVTKNGRGINEKRRKIRCHDKGERNNIDESQYKEKENLYEKKLESTQKKHESLSWEKAAQKARCET